MDLLIICLIFGILIGIVIVIGFCVICGKVAESKNLDLNHRWLGLLGVLGIIVILFLKPNFCKCPNCGFEFDPNHGCCPACKYDINSLE